MHYPRCDRSRTRRCLPRRRPRSRGFALFMVVLILAITSAAVAVTLDESIANVRNLGTTRSRELIKSGLEHGLHLGITQVQQLDATTVADPANDWDIFRLRQSVPVSDRRDFIGPLLYPPAGPYARQYRVRVGLRPGQRTRAPAGEDVRNAYGQVVELQIGVEANQPGMPPAEERISVGVLLPRSSSHAN